MERRNFLRLMTGTAAAALIPALSGCVVETVAYRPVPVYRPTPQPMYRPAPAPRPIYRAPQYYYYYPSVAVYYHVSTGYYWYFEDGFWLSARRLPRHIRLTGPRHKFESRSEHPYEYYHDHRRYYGSPQRGRGPDANWRYDPNLRDRRRDGDDRGNGRDRRQGEDGRINGRDRRREPVNGRRGGEGDERRNRRQTPEANQELPEVNRGIGGGGRNQPERGDSGRVEGRDRRQDPVNGRGGREGDERSGVFDRNRRQEQPNNRSGGRDDDDGNAGLNRNRRQEPPNNRSGGRGDDDGNAGLNRNRRQEQPNNRNGGRGDDDGNAGFNRNRRQTPETNRGLPEVKPGNGNGGRNQPARGDSGRAEGQVRGRDDGKGKKKGEEQAVPWLPLPDEQ